MADVFLMGNGGAEKELVVQTITTSQTYTVPADVSLLFVWMCGGGAGGGQGGGGGNDTVYCGGSSGNTVNLALPVTPGQQFSVVIGAGGAAGAVGGDTSFGSYIARGAGVGFTNPDPGSTFGYGEGSVYGAAATGAYLGTAMTGKSGGIDSTSGRTGSGSSSRLVDAKGYCWLNGQVYCGGGACQHHVIWTGTGSYPAQSADVEGGGGKYPAVVLGTTLETSSFPAGGNATGYGAGGCSPGSFVYYSSWSYTSPGGAGRQGIVVVGYYA